MTVNGKKNRPDCFRCRHLRITYEPAHPYACAAMGFKSKIIPYLEAFRASGIPCQMFQEKKRGAGG